VAEITNPIDHIARLELLARMAEQQGVDRFFPLGTAGQDDGTVLLGVSQKNLKVDLDKSKMVIHGCLSYEEPDRVKELLVLDGLDLSGFQRNPMGLFQHIRTCPVGLFQDENKNFTVKRVGKSLNCALHVVQKGPQAAIAEQVFGLVDSGILNGFSLGFMQNWKSVKRIPDDAADPYGSAVMRIEQSKAYEGSLVFIPENDRTLVTQVVRKGLATGSGLKQLDPFIRASLLPFAEPDAEWVMGGWVDPTTTQKELTVSQTPTTPTPSPTPPASGVTEVVKEIRVEVVPPEVKALADRGQWMDKHIGNGMGLPLSDFSGKPSQKALAAMHELAMMGGLQAFAALEEVDGPAEKELADFARNQFSIASGLVEKYKALFGADPDWKFLSPDDFRAISFSAPTPDAITKELGDRAKVWVARSKGWKKGHAGRCASAAKCLKELSGCQSLTDDHRKSASHHANMLETMVNEKGMLVDVNDEAEAQIKALKEVIDKIEAEHAKLKKELQRAKYGM